MKTKRIHGTASNNANKRGQRLLGRWSLLMQYDIAFQWGQKLLERSKPNDFLAGMFIPVITSRISSSSDSKLKYCKIPFFVVWNCQYNSTRKFFYKRLYITKRIPLGLGICDWIGLCCWLSYVYTVNCSNFRLQDAWAALTTGPQRRPDQLPENESPRRCTQNLGAQAVNKRCIFSVYFQADFTVSHPLKFY